MMLTVLAYVYDVNFGYVIRQITLRKQLCLGVLKRKWLFNLNIYDIQMCMIMCLYKIYIYSNIL